MSKTNFHLKHNPYTLSYQFTGNTINDEVTDVLSRETSPVCSSSLHTTESIHDFPPEDISYTLENLTNDTHDNNGSDNTSTGPDIKVHM